MKWIETVKDVLVTTLIVLIAILITFVFVYLGAMIAIFVIKNFIAFILAFLGAGGFLTLYYIIKNIK